MVVPVVMPDTMPLSEPITATAVALLVHTPPTTTSVRVVVAIPTQAVDEPMIGPGAGLTLIVVVILHPVAVTI